MSSPEEFNKLFDDLLRARSSMYEDLVDRVLVERTLDDAINFMTGLKSEPASNDYKAGFRACANMIDSLIFKPWYNTASPSYGPWKDGFDFAVEHIKDVARRGADLVEGVPNERRNKFPEDR